MSSVLFKIASRGVWKNWRHSLGSTLAVAVGFAAIALFDGYLDDFGGTLTRMMEERFMMGTLVVEATGATEALKKSKAEKPLLGEAEQAFVEGWLGERAHDVEVRMRSLIVEGLASNGRASPRFGGWGLDPVESARIRRRFAWDAYYGRPLHEAGPDSVLVGKGMGALLDCVPATSEPPLGPRGVIIPRERPFTCARSRLQLMATTDSGQVNAVEATVVGLVDGGRKELDAYVVTMPLAMVQRLRNTRGISMYTVLLRDPSTAARFSRELVAGARARGLAIDAMPWQESYYGEQYSQGMSIIHTFRQLMAVVVVVIVGMGVFTTMVKAVNERTREIGTLRSLGFLRGQVASLFALEAALLSAAACVLGLGATLAVTAAVNGSGLMYDAGLLSEPIPLGVAVDPLSYLRVAAFLVAVSIVAAWLPARRAARRTIPDALAHA